MRQRILGQSILWLIALVVCAPTAWSANLIAVRVGNHPDFTRIVFEFDEPTGYQITRASGLGEAALVITFEASSHVWNIDPKAKGAVAAVHVEPGVARAVANVVLRDSRSMLKEMILANPPRVVLDLMKEDAPAAAKPKATAKAQPEPVAKLPIRVPGPPEIVKPAPAPMPVAPEVTAEPIEIDPTETEWQDGAGGSAAVAKPSIPKPQGLQEAGLIEVTVPPHTVEPVPAPERVAKPTPAPERTVRKPVAHSEEASGGMGSLAWIAGVLAVGIGLLVFFMRRRSLPTDVDVTTLAIDAPDAQEGAAEERVPAAGFAMDADGEGVASEATKESSTDSTQAAEASVEAAAQPAEVAAQSAEVAAESRDGGSAGGSAGAFGPGDPQPPEKEPSEEDEVETSLFDKSLEGDQTMMNQDVNDLSGSQTQMQQNFPPPVAPDPDVARLLQEMERRVTQLESRLDESVEARERLERQVAAQSEELRVQRAAIARTQRALRSLSRSEEEQATEPALRDPAKPSPRG